MTSLPPAFVISLSNETQRRTRITTLFDEIGFPFEFIDAVDGRQFNVLNHPFYNPSKRLRNFGTHMTGGEIGCTLSHRKAYQKMIDNNINQALIFEDDIILRDGFLEIMQEILKMDIDYDMIRFFGSPKLERLKMRPVCRIKGEHFLTRHSGIPGGAHATLITLSGAKKMLQQTQKNAFPIDALMGRSWQTGLNWYTIRPGLAAQDLSFDSAIGEERFEKNKDLSGLTKIFYPFTRAWFKLCETFGKKYWYYKSYLKDKKLKDAHHG